MAQIPRLLMDGEPAVYHVISRTALPDFPLGDMEIRQSRVVIDPAARRIGSAF
jgi:hypothetical protein